MLTANDPGKASFGAASSFNQWGGVVANVSVLNSLVRLVATLVHEATHLLLFGMAMDEPLLSAEAGRRFASPLRDELRTMDGVYHATIVCARMHYGLGRLLNSDRLADAERTSVLRTMRYQHERFQAGAKTVRDNADLSSMAGRMLREAETYLATHREAP
jgi:HEXXH motif-containing protein